MTDQEDKINLGKTVFDDNNWERKSCAYLGQTCSRSLIVFLSQIFVIWLSSFVAFGELTLQKLMTNQLFVLQLCAVRRDTVYPRQDCEQVDFFKKSSLHFIVWSSRNWKNTFFLQLVKNWNNSTKVWQNLLFYQLSQHLYDVMQKKIENLEFVRGVNFEFIDSLRNNCTKYLLILRLLWRELQINVPCWHWHHWKTWGPEHKLH